MARLSRKDFEVTPIVAYGIVFLLLVLGGLGLQKFWGIENVLESEVIAVQSELASLETLRGDSEWAARFERSLVDRQFVDASIWSGQTTGVIAAELQQSLRALATGLGYDRIQVRVDPDSIDLDGAGVLSFEFAGRAPDGKAIVSLFEGVAVNPKQIVIRDVDFSQNVRDRTRPRLAIGGIIPIRIMTKQAQQKPTEVLDSMTGLPVRTRPRNQGARRAPDPMIAPNNAPSPVQRPVKEGQ